jgi:hypothetical protein
MYIFNILNTSKLFFGITMLTMNIGGRYVSDEIPEVVKKLFQLKVIKALFVFSVIFIGTKDTKVSILITLIFLILFRYLLRTNSKLCILPQHIINLDINKDGIIDSNEIKQSKIYKTLQKL